MSKIKLKLNDSFSVFLTKSLTPKILKKETLGHKDVNKNSRGTSHPFHVLLFLVLGVASYNKCFNELQKKKIIIMSRNFFFTLFFAYHLSNNAELLKPF